MAVQCTDVPRAQSTESQVFHLVIVYGHRGEHCFNVRRCTIHELPSKHPLASDAFDLLHLRRHDVRSPTRESKGQQWVLPESSEKYLHDLFLGVMYALFMLHFSMVTFFRVSIRMYTGAINASKVRRRPRCFSISIRTGPWAWVWQSHSRAKGPRATDPPSLRHHAVPSLLLSQEQ
jgi:hypothetical protein